MIKRYPFEGEMLTISQIAKRAPAFGVDWLRDHVPSKGLQSIADLNRAWNEALAARVRAGRKAALHPRSQLDIATRTTSRFKCARIRSGRLRDWDALCAKEGK
jgi:hypothetical protein